MHFSKSYEQFLLSLPPQLSEDAINYRQLKKSINGVVQELTLLGLGPEVVRDLVKPGEDVLNAMGGSHISDSEQTTAIRGHTTINSGLRLQYEVNNDLGHLVPRLRFIVDKDMDVDTMPCVPVSMFVENSPADSSAREYIIPLASDTAFFDLLTSAINNLSTRLITVHSDFMADLGDLSKSISASALSISQTDPSYRPFSIGDDPGAIDVPSTKPIFRPSLDSRSDLYLWRNLLNFYVDAEVFDSVAERSRGERPVEDAEIRMTRFLERVKKSGVLHGKSNKAYFEVERFFKLNGIILDLKKLHHASSEATRKILKKHVKRTALPFPRSLPREIVSAVGAVDVKMTAGPPPMGQTLISFTRHPGPLPQLLVQAIGEMILPIIPHVDDYSCNICTNIAFKPIRLSCRHLFCVRCLVKMQKQGQANCPMCRSSCVLVADRSNVDLALMNFMADWFPVESRAKLQSDGREVSAELARELGFASNWCMVM